MRKSPSRRALAKYKETTARVKLVSACLVNDLVPQRGREEGEKNPKTVSDELQKRPPPEPVRGCRELGVDGQALDLYRAAVASWCQEVMGMAENRKVGMNVRFDPALHDRLRRVAFELRRKQADIVREALLVHLERLEGKLKDAKG